MKTKKEIKDWLLENAVNDYGNLDLSYMDFSDFDGDINIGNMKVKGDLLQSHQKVKGNLYQNNQEVQGNLFQGFQEVQGNLKTQALEKDEEEIISIFGNIYIVKKEK